MDTETIKCFIQVAKSLNFTKAAEECHITQTAMSRKISTLEQELGMILFYRDNRQVELTPAGREFYNNACGLLEYYTAAVIHTQNVANGFESSLKIGIGAYEHVLIQSTLEAYCRLYPNADISCMQFSYSSLAEQLSKHLVDVMISSDQYLYSIPDIQYIILTDEPWKIGCSCLAPLADSDTISISELSKYPLISMNDGSHDQIKRSYQYVGFEPCRIYSVNSYSTKILMMQANLGVALLPNYMKDVLPTDIKLLSTVPEFTPRKFAASYLKGNSNPAIPKFIDILVGKNDTLHAS